MAYDKRTVKRKIGDRGEDIACGYLRKDGCEILARNYLCRFGEIDIIAIELKSSTLIFAEVKTRNRTDYGLPCEFVNKKKQKAIIRTAELFLAENKSFSSYTCRMDIVEVLILKKGVYVRHLKNAF